MTEGRARLFVALELSKPALETLVRWRAQALGSVPGLRLVRAEGLHITLCFLGWRPEPEIDAIAAACTAARRAAAGGLSLGAAVWLPSRRPRVVAVTVADARGELADLQASLAETLSAGGWYEPQARPFLGHVTVARVARGERLRTIELSAPEPVAWVGAGVTLYRSRLVPGGARYEALSR